jgi:hypothetical protein
MPGCSKDTPDGELEEIVEKKEFMSILKKQNANLQSKIFTFLQKRKERITL